MPKITATHFKHTNTLAILLLLGILAVPKATAQQLEPPLERTFALGLVHRYDQQTWLELSGSWGLYPLLQLRETACITLEGTAGFHVASVFESPIDALIPKEWSLGLGMRGLGPPSSSLSFNASSFVGLGVWGSTGVDLGVYLQGGVLLPIDPNNDLSLSIRLLEDGNRQRADVQLGWQFNY